jgi:plasmid stability protein
VGGSRELDASDGPRLGSGRHDGGGDECPSGQGQLRKLAPLFNTTAPGRYRDIILAGGGPVAQFVVRHLEDDVAEKLKQRAKRHARSMEDEVRHILRAAVRDRPISRQRLGTRIAQRFQRAGLTADLPEFKGVAARAAKLDL